MVSSEVLKTRGISYNRGFLISISTDWVGVLVCVHAKLKSNLSVVTSPLVSDCTVPWSWSFHRATLKSPPKRSYTSRDLLGARFGIPEAGSSAPRSSMDVKPAD